MVKVDGLIKESLEELIFYSKFHFGVEFLLWLLYMILYILYML